MTADETDEGRAVADALVILGSGLHRISIEGTGRFKYEPADPLCPNRDRRTPTEFIRRSMTHLLARYREVLKLTMVGMYVQYGDTSHHKTMKKGAR